MSAVPRQREVIALVWYPAKPGTGEKAPYIPNLNRIASGLRASGEVNPIEVAGLPLIRTSAMQDASVSTSAETYPVIVLSPGSGTNVEFYSALAEDLASHGYIVVGINHPYDVAAVALSDGTVAQYVLGPMDFQQRAAFTADRIAQHVTDLRFALDQLEALNASGAGLLAGRLDLDLVAAVGHSIGGITAVQACEADPRFDACANLDGLQSGGPFSADENPTLPVQPFLFLTKEEELHPRIVQMLEALSAESYLVVIHGASHDSFTDGPSLIPSPLPLPNKADRIMASTRSYLLAFLDHTLRGEEQTLLAEPSSTDVTVTEYPE